MATQKERYEEHLRFNADSLVVTLAKRDWAFQMIAEQYESVLAEKDKQIAAAWEDADDAKAALTLKEANHNNEIHDLKEDHEAIVNEMCTDLTATKTKLEKSEKSIKQLRKKIKVLEGKVETQTPVAADLTPQLDVANEEIQSLKVRNSTLINANQTALASHENLVQYIWTQQNAYFSYHEENKDLKIQVQDLRNKLPHVDKDRYQLLEEIACLTASAQQREFDLMVELSMLRKWNNTNADSATYYYQEMCNAQQATMDLKEDFNKAGKANERIHTLYGDLKKEFDEYKEDTEGLEENIDDLETRLETLKKFAEKERQNLIQMINMLQNDNKALSADIANLEEVFARRIRLFTNAIRDPEHPDHRALFEIFRNSDSKVEEVAYSTDGTSTPFLVRNLPVEQAMIGQYEQMEGMFLSSSN